MPDARQNTFDDLIARTAKGDRRAFDALYESTSAQMNALCLAILKDRREAEEALEQTYVRVWQGAARIGESGLSTRAWLATLSRDSALERRDALSMLAVPALDPDIDAVELVRIAYLEGLDYPQLATRMGVSAEEARHRLNEGLGRIAGHAAEDADSLAVAEHVLGLRTGPEQAPDAAQLTGWQERLARFADDLTPVMAPARARQRIREQLGHGAAPLSIDPLERRPWWRGPMGILVAILLIAAAWYALAR